MVLSYIQSIQSAEENARRTYLETAGFKLPESKFEFLNVKLGTTPASYNLPSSKPSKENLHFVFGVGNGSDDSIATRRIKSFVKTTKASIVEWDIPEDEAGKDTIGSTGLISIIPLHFSNVRDGLTPDYRVFNPVCFANYWYRKYYTKEAQVTKITNYGETELDDSIRVTCILTKEDLNIKSFVTGDSISEICVYAGVLVQIFENSRNYPAAYFNYNRPKEDLINVVPIFKIQFEPIKVDSIPENGIAFVFDLTLDTATVVEPESSTDTETSSDEEPEPTSNQTSEPVPDESDTNQTGESVDEEPIQTEV